MDDRRGRVPTLDRSRSRIRAWRHDRVEQGPGDAPSSTAWNVPDRTVVLAGHRRLLDQVERTLQSGRRALLCPPTGRTGTGATTAMVEFVHRNACDYDIVWWIRATDPELVPDEMAALAEELGVAGAGDDAETAAARALQVLRHRDRYLLVFDDAANPRQLSRFLPTGTGHVVIISSDSEWRPYAAAHAVEPFTRAESIALLRAGRPDLPIDDAARVAAVLEDLPPAVDQAATWLRESGMSAGSFLRLLSHGRGGDPDPVTATWTTAFDRVNVRDPIGSAVLTLVAWLGPDPVPFRLLAEHPHVLPAGPVDVARRRVALPDRIDDLGRLGLISVTAAGLRLPRMPAALLVAGTADARFGSGGWADVAIRLLRAAVPDDAADATARVEWRQLLPLVLAATDPARRLGGSAAEAAWLLRKAASYLRVRGQERTAEVLIRDADDLEPLRGPEAPGVRAAPPGPELCRTGQA